MTKRKELIKSIKQYAKDTNQPYKEIEGGNHTRIWVGKSYTTISRHNEIPNRMAAKIQKQIGMKE